MQVDRGRVKANAADRHIPEWAGPPVPPSSGPSEEEPDAGLELEVVHLVVVHDRDADLD